jgi:hypothetical protein
MKMRIVLAIIILLEFHGAAWGQESNTDSGPEHTAVKFTRALLEGDFETTLSLSSPSFVQGMIDVFLVSYLTAIEKNQVEQFQAETHISLSIDELKKLPRGELYLLILRSAFQPVIPPNPEITVQVITSSRTSDGRPLVKVRGHVAAPGHKTEDIDLGLVLEQVSGKWLVILGS